MTGDIEPGQTGQQPIQIKRRDGLIANDHDLLCSNMSVIEIFSGKKARADVNRVTARTKIYIQYCQSFRTSPAISLAAVCGDRPSVS